MGMRSLHPPPKGPAEGGALGEGLKGPYAQRKGFRDQTGPLKPASTPPHVATIHHSRFRSSRHTSMASFAGSRTNVRHAAWCSRVCRPRPFRLADCSFGGGCASAQVSPNHSWFFLVRVDLLNHSRLCFAWFFLVSISLNHNWLLLVCFVAGAWISFNHLLNLSFRKPRFCFWGGSSGFSGPPVGTARV